ncbi:MAG: IS66 family transposase [Alphaproteobacteria bacterium]|nr:IS66 family transposase [Alphaproteobacteria bacterium]
MYQDDFAKLSKEALIALVLAQAAQIEELTRRITELEAKPGGPPKTPDNSSLPPSQGRKPNRAERRAAQKRKGRPGVFRALAPHPDRIVASVAQRCPHCEHALTVADQVGFHAYDHIELPPIRPVITRIHRHRGVCPSCRRGFSAPPPAGMPPGSPFGPDLVALILHLHVTQAIGFERLVRLLDEVFGIRISQGAIANMLARTGIPLTAAAETTAAAVRRSPVVASDETSARVAGKNWWQWVLLSSTAVHHLIADSRGAAVLTGFLGDAKPDVWVADRYAAQAGHGNERQLCLAHLLRDAQYAIEAGDTGFAPGFHKLLQRAVAIGQRRAELKDTTLAQYRADLDRKLDRLLAVNPTAEAGRKLARGIRKCRGDLFVFVTRRDVPATNNDCERALRPSVIFRKVTGGFRSQWGARTYADAASVIATGRLNGRSAFHALRDALAGRPILVPP